MILDTSPSSPPTHWKQTIIMLPNAVGFNVEQGTQIDCRITLATDEVHARRYNLTLDLGDEQEDQAEEELNDKTEE